MLTEACDWSAIASAVSGPVRSAEGRGLVSIAREACDWGVSASPASGSFPRALRSRIHHETKDLQLVLPCLSPFGYYRFVHRSFGQSVSTRLVSSMCSVAYVTLTVLVDDKLHQQARVSPCIVHDSRTFNIFFRICFHEVSGSKKQNFPDEID